MGSINSIYPNLKQRLIAAGGGGGGNLSGLDSVASRSYIQYLEPTNQNNNSFSLLQDIQGFPAVFPISTPPKQLKALEINYFDIKKRPDFTGTVDLDNIVVWIGFFAGINNTTPASVWNCAQFLNRGDCVVIDDSRCYGTIKATVGYYDYFRADTTSNILPVNSVTILVRCAAYWEA
ncbi:hypothetical protein NG798_27690 [Ancylothrix sp. C2]|uniref:hypothetical protein n=1 Tax=Ancylothrix sp. D3o TaxID=2953691 RepID=UPI0021BAEA36|nr:hypothetical protein [Ancylothrix sp. D3o]MCT7953584.1 hypothetical protein [Ancylothrix sp. D3o]